MKKIGIIGFGNMGEAILKGIISSKIAESKDIFISDIDSAKLNHVKRHYNVNATFNSSNVAKSSDIIIIAVKPQDIDSTLNDIQASLSKKKLLISIAAGITMKKIASYAVNSVPIVRVMPNMPVFINQGFSAICFSDKVEKSLQKLSITIFKSIGDCVEVKEKDMDAITAISGSGPAYFFYLVENLVKSGVAMGLNHETAREAALKTALGSVNLLNIFGEEASTLRKRVTSKGGTTEAAFEVFKKNKLGQTLHAGIKAARDRSKELSGG